MKNNKKLARQLKSDFGTVKDDDFQFDLIRRYFNKRNHSADYQIISDKTCNDLDFDELFMFLDRTNSGVGQQVLYEKLKSISQHADSLEFKESIIKELTKNEDLRCEIQLLLKKLNSDGSYYISSLFQEDHDSPPKWFFITKFLSFASLLSLCLIPINAYIILVFLALFIINSVIHYWNKRNLYKYLDSIPQLVILSNIAQKINNIQLFKQLNPRLMLSIKVINQVRNRMSFFRIESRMQGEIQSLIWGILELFKIAVLLEPLLLFGVLKRLKQKRKEIEDIFCFVGEVDCLISIASLRKGLASHCVPTINNSKIIAKSIYHPLIIDCVPNNIEVVDKSILLSGSNMSGKTSFIRTIGINMLCGLTINTCFAESMAIPKMQIHSAIRISDDLLNDKSYYFEEVLTIKKMLDKSVGDIPNIFLLDEIFKGTNTIERIAAGKAVLSKLNKGQNIVFVSTHDVELADLLKDEYTLYHFCENTKDGSIDFDYKLKPGKLKQRNAIKILELNNYPDDVIKTAKMLSDELDKISKSKTFNK